MTKLSELLFNYLGLVTFFLYKLVVCSCACVCVCVPFFFVFVCFFMGHAACNKSLIGIIIKRFAAWKRFV